MSGEHGYDGWHRGFAFCLCGSSFESMDGFESHIGMTPTPEPSEVAETTAGEREVDASLLLAISDPGATTPRLPNENVTAWSARAVLASPWLAAHVSAAETKARADERERIAQAIEATVNTWRVEADDDERWLNGNRVSASEAQELPALIRQARTHIREITNAASIARGDAR